MITYQSLNFKILTFVLTLYSLNPTPDSVFEILFIAIIFIYLFYLFFYFAQSGTKTDPHISMDIFNTKQTVFSFKITFSLSSHSARIDSKIKKKNKPAYITPRAGAIILRWKLGKYGGIVYIYIYIYVKNDYKRKTIVSKVR